MTLREWFEKEYKGSLVDLASDLHISYSHLWRLLNGRVKEPKATLIAKIWEISSGKVTPADLLRGEGEKEGKKKRKRRKRRIKRVKKEN